MAKHKHEARPHPGPGRQHTVEVLEPWLAVIHMATSLTDEDWQILYGFAIDLANARMLAEDEAEPAWQLLPTEGWQVRDET